VCGTPFARILSVEGRKSEQLTLHTEAGGTAIVNPLVVEGPLHARRDIRRFQLRNPASRCELLVVWGRRTEGAKMR
tara:strand:+ start:376 stop:603 length:228 start_codon:yes stop_codon:yes gene_type:complete